MRFNSNEKYKKPTYPPRERSFRTRLDCDYQHVESQYKESQRKKNIATDPPQGGYYYSDAYGRVDPEYMYK
jgi:hypothetical protein